jgi:UDPglucose 6-dehydrogenase
MIRPTRISVIGTGYLGATHAASMAELGFEVVGVDVDQAKVDSLNAGVVPFFEPDLAPMLERHTASGRLRFTTDAAEAARFASVHFVCVGTPQKKGLLAADVSYVEAAVDAMAPHLSAGDVVVGKSTVPVGTAVRLRQRLRSQARADVDLVWNPEFLREGFGVEDTLRPDRIVIGTDSERSRRVIEHVYASMLERGTPFLVTDFATAELVKTAANAFLATKISFINAMAEVCERTGADVTQLAQAIGHDVRIGHRFLGSGVGFGGGCLPKDIRALRARATELGLEDSLSFLALVDRINVRRRERVIELVEHALGGRVAGKVITVLGAAFKPNTDDVRDSPALAVASELHRIGGVVRIYDPMAGSTAAARLPDVAYADSPAEACADADVVVVLTEWREFVALDPQEVASWVRQATVVDARNCLDADAWGDAGWYYLGLGRLHPRPHAAPALADVPETVPAGGLAVAPEVAAA